jgi:hypothetical protein
MEPDSSASGIYQNRPEIASMAVTLLHSQLLKAHNGLVAAPASIQIQPAWNEGFTLPSRAP